jgi:putative salt-induced outer membrane protein YdiY
MLTSFCVLGLIPLVFGLPSDDDALPPATTTFPPATTTFLPQGEEEEAAPEEDAVEWTGSVRFSWIRTSGNDNDSDILFNGDAELLDGNHRYSATTWWIFSESGTDPPDRSAGIIGQYDFLVSERRYYFARSTAEGDTESGIDLRWQAGAGAGYTFVKSESFNLAGDLGLGYLDETYDPDGDPTTPSERDSTVVQLSYKLGWSLSKNTRFKQDFDSFTNTEDSSDVQFRLDSVFETSVTESMLASAQYLYKWDNTPSPGSGSEDHRLVFSLGWAW